MCTSLHGMASGSDTESALMSFDPISPGPGIWLYFTAPYEFTFLLDQYLKNRGIRQKTNIHYIYPLNRGTCNISFVFILIDASSHIVCYAMGKVF